MCFVRAEGFGAGLVFFFWLRGWFGLLAEDRAGNGASRLMWMVWVVARGGWVYVKRAVVRIGGGWVDGCSLVWLSVWCGLAGWLAGSSE